MRVKLFSIIASCLFFMAMCGMLLAGGRGPEDPACNDLPRPIRGPFLWGTFTAALDQSQCSVDFPEECGHFSVHAVLWNYRAVHLYSFPVPFGEAGLCTLDDAALKAEFARVPCSLAVGTDFGLSGTPVIKSLAITKRDFCDNPQKQMIQGVILLRVVP